MSKKKKELEELIICACGEPEHQMIFRTIDGDDDVYVSIYLVKLPFFKRLWFGIKYIFGYQSKYGAFDEIIITKKHTGTIEKVLNWLKQNHNPVI